MPYAEDPRLPAHLAPYYACITWLDETVGELLGALRQRGLLKETLVVFVVDNGYVVDPENPNLSVRSKNTPFEQGLRTPDPDRLGGSGQTPNPCRPGEHRRPGADAAGGGRHRGGWQGSFRG